tara:strand:- start:118 stop:921 length:804 start_codon:yes stop_codon:yes gene_type:complete
MANLLFYENPLALNRVRHKDMKIKPGGNDFSFAKNTNLVILAGVEFSEAAKEYPIVFAQVGESIVPVALLGLRNAENLFVSDDGAWDALYIPAFVRRYPFVLAETPDNPDQRMVCIDENFAGVNEKDGEPLFENGEATPLLQQAIDFLEEYQKQYLRTEAFLNRLNSLDLLMSLNAKIELTCGQEFILRGLLVVDEKKLLALDDLQALELFRSGELSWVYCHLMSIGILSVMINRLAAIVNVEAGIDEAEGDEKNPHTTPKKAIAKK